MGSVDDNFGRKYSSNPVKRKFTHAGRLVNRPSQITKKKPSKRLLRRRMADTMPGYFPNPDDGQIIGLVVEAPVDTYGNPRRGALFWKCYPDHNVFIGFKELGYNTSYRSFEGVNWLGKIEVNASSFNAMKKSRGGFWTI